MEGYWCVSCETANGYAPLDGDGDPVCAHCGAGEWDLWRIAGDFKHGEHIPTASDRLASLRHADEEALV